MTKHTVLRALRAIALLLARVIPVMLGVVIAVFFLLRLVPGDPASMILGDQATEASILALQEQLGLNLPLSEQFTAFITQVFTEFDTGDSLVTGLSTREMILAKAPISLLIVLLSVLFAVLIAVPLALAAALNKDGWADQIVRVLPTVGLGMPLFWVGLLLITVFAVQLQWLPVGDIGTGPWEPLRSLILPALAVALGMAPPLIRSLRSELIDALAADHVLTLRAAGVPERTIVLKHVLRASVLPALTLLSVNTAYLIGGTLVVEKVFGINGVGTLLFTSITSRDFPVVQGIALYCAAAVVLVTTVTSLLSALLDPRLRAAAPVRGPLVLPGGDA